MSILDFPSIGKSGRGNSAMRNDAHISLSPTISYNPSNMSYK